MKLSFNLKLSQSLKLTPLLQQSIKLLQASQSELNQLIEDYANDNIFLELEETTDNYLASQTNFNNSKEISVKNDYSYELFDTEIKNQTLKEYLIENLSIFSFSDRDQIIFLILIDSINDDGYLIESLEKIIEIMPFEPKPELKELENILMLIQNSSSPGIGARNLSECLCLQLKIIKGDLKLINLGSFITRTLIASRNALIDFKGLMVTSNKSISPSLFNVIKSTPTMSRFPILHLNSKAQSLLLPIILVYSNS